MLLENVSVFLVDLFVLEIAVSWNGCREEQDLEKEEIREDFGSDHIFEAEAKTEGFFWDFN